MNLCATILARRLVPLLLAAWASGVESRAAERLPALEVDQVNVPVLVNRRHNGLLRLTLRGPCALQGLVLRTDDRLVQVHLARAQADGDIDADAPGDLVPLREVAPPDTARSRATRERRFTCEPLALEDGEHVLWLLGSLAATADLDLRLEVTPLSLSIDGASLSVPDESARLINGGLRLGRRVRHRGDDGSKGYRIPGLVRTNRGSLLACYDIRRDGNRDLQGDMDIGISRSTDGGRTFEPMRIAQDMGTFGGLPERFNGVSDAGLLVDSATGRVFLFSCWMHGLRDKEGRFREDLTEESTDWAHQWHRGPVGSGPGLGPRETAQFIVSYSDDDGRTWSEPVSLTEQLKEPSEYLLAPAPGNGITLRDGTLVMPIQGRDAEQLPFSTVMLSSDHGETWKRAPAVARRDTTESAVVELSSGALMLNMRDNRNRGRHGEDNGRAVAVTRDRGKSWRVHASDHRRDLLPEPVCMASLVRIEREDAKDVLLFSNPSSTRGRRGMTIKVSFDDGESWPRERWLELDALGGAYSSLARADDETIGILYESSQGYLVFQRVPIRELGIGD